MPWKYSIKQTLIGNELRKHPTLAGNNVKNSKINLILLSACLISILAVATNALLTVHLASCVTEHKTDNEHSRDKSNHPVHNSKSCSTCQLFLDLSGKYISQATAACIVVHTQSLQNIFFISDNTNQNELICAISRGPPCA